MQRPPPDARDRPPFDQPTWERILAGYGLMAALLLGLWFVSHPVTGTVTVALVAIVFIGTRHAVRLVRCVRNCRAATFHLGAGVRITISQTRTDDAN